MTVCPKPGASDTRTLRGIIGASTSSPKWLRTSSATWSASRVRLSYIVSSTVLTASVGLRCERHQLDGVQQLGQALERVVLALDRDEHLAGGDQRVEGEQPE